MRKERGKREEKRKAGGKREKSETGKREEKQRKE